MNLWTRRLGMAALGLSVTLVACTDSGLAPELHSMDALSADPLALTTSTGENVLKWADAFAETRTVTQNIGTWGGLMTIDGLISLTVPPGAMDETIELSMTAFAGEDVAFEFGPHGTQFNQPVSIWLDLCAVTGIEAVAPSSSMMSINAVSSAKGGGKSKSAGTNDSWKTKRNRKTDAADGYKPDESAPEPEAPQTEGSDADFPEPDVPDEEVAGPQVPEADVPQDSVPDDSTPEAGTTSTGMSSICDGNWWEGHSWGGFGGDTDNVPMLNVGGLVAVYFTDGGPVIETLDILEVELVLNRYLRFDTDHFSGYALAW